MMKNIKNIKNIIIYGVILLLCIAAFAGYLMTNKPETAANNSTPATTGAPAGTTAPASSETTAAVATAASATTTSEAATIPQGRIAELMKKASVEPDPNPIVGIGRGQDYAKVTEEAIKNAGGLEGIIKKGDTVLIKPNICTYAGAGSAQITDYRTVQKVAQMAASLGAKRIIVADGTIAGNAFSSLFLEVNMYDKIKGVELVDLNNFTEKDCYELKPEKSLTGKALFIPKIYMDADVVISVAKLKTHFQPDAAVSLSLKNSYGVPPGLIYGVGSKDGLHALGLVESVIDLNRIRKPDLAIIEGIVGGEGNGPLSNDPVQSGIIFAGKDLVALDTVGLTFMGYTVNDVNIVKRAGEEGLGISDLSKIKVVGADLNSIKMNFKPAMSP